MKFILRINIKISIIVGILTFISRINVTSEQEKTLIFGSLVFVRSCNVVFSKVEHENGFITLGLIFTLRFVKA